MSYDGSTGLQQAIADLYGLSARSQAPIASLIKEAKTALNLPYARKMPPEANLSAYQWHVEKLTAVQDIKQTDSSDNDVYDVKQSDSGLLSDDSVQDVKQSNLELKADESVQDIKQSDYVYDVKQLEPLDNKQPVYNIKQADDFEQVHFALTIGDRRTTVMLEGYLVKALSRKLGLSTRSSIRAWLEKAIANDTRFDPTDAITKQTKRLIIEAIV